MTPVELDAHLRTTKAAAFSKLKTGGVKIERTIRGSLDLLSVGRHHPNWLVYVDFVNGIVVNGLIKVS